METDNEKNKSKGKIRKSLSDFLYEEEGNISRGKILTVGSLLLLAGIIFADEVFGAHRSHSSHSSHSSSSSGYSSSHGSHVSHQSHQSHQSGGSTHSSHSSSSVSSYSEPAGTTSSSGATHTTSVNPPAVTKPVEEPLPSFQKPQIPPDTPSI